MIPVFEKMLENLSNSGKRLPNPSHAAARTSFCKNTCGGTDVARETRAAVGIARTLSCRVSYIREHQPGSFISMAGEKHRPNGSLKWETCAPHSRLRRRLGSNCEQAAVAPRSSSRVRCHSEFARGVEEVHPPFNERTRLFSAASAGVPAVLEGRIGQNALVSVGFRCRTRRRAGCLVGLAGVGCGLTLTRRAGSRLRLERCDRRRFDQCGDHDG